MKKLAKTRSEHFYPVKLFIDDIESIVDIIKETTNEKIHIQTADYAINDLSELSEIPEEEICDLEIRTYVVSPITCQVTNNNHIRHCESPQSA